MSDARSFVRSGRAFIGSCSWRSCWRRSFRCSRWPSSSASTSRTCCSPTSRPRRRARPPSPAGSSKSPTCCRGAVADAFDALNDDIMVWIRQVIDQDVNIFDGPRLVATSERDLFASGLLPTRTPDDVYRAVVLERQASYVSTDRIGTVPYLIAAAPVRGPWRDRLLTVPLAPRQREIGSGDRRARSRRAPRVAVLHPARRGDRSVDGRAHRRSGAAADEGDASHCAWRLRCAHCRAISRRAEAAGGCVQQHGRGAQGPARAVGAHAPPRGLGRDGASGRARNQEPADTDSVVGRAPPPRPRGSR